MIKLLAHENTPKRTVQTLKQRDIDITSVLDSPTGLSDRAVIELANRENRVIVTFDKDLRRTHIQGETESERSNSVEACSNISRTHSRENRAHTGPKIPIANKIIVIREDRIRVTSLS